MRPRPSARDPLNGQNNSLASSSSVCTRAGAVAGSVPRWADATGCTITQGFVHSPPLPPDDLRDWIAVHAPTSQRSKSRVTGVTD